MPQSLAQIYIHIAFSTKNRVPLLTDATIRSRLHAYIGGVCRDADSPALTVGGTEDHLHLLCRLSKNLAAKDLLQETKRASSVWVKQQAPPLADFHWQAGYGAFSIGYREIERVAAYIAAQEQHHKVEGFQDELRRLFRENGIEWDERYVWD